MRRYLVLIVIVMNSGISIYSQDSINMVKILNIEQDIIDLENRIASSIKINNPEIANIQGLRQYHILWLESYTNKKDNMTIGYFAYNAYICL